MVLQCIVKCRRCILIKIPLAIYYTLALSTLPFAYSTNSLKYAGPNDDFFVAPFGGGEVDKPACAIPLCEAGNGYTRDYYPTVSGYCNGQFPTTKYYRHAKSVNVWNCPGGVFYYTCTDAGEDETICGSHSTFTCPDGNCDPYDPGHAG